MLDDLVFEQVEVGPMQNFSYLLGSRQSGEALLVDPAWDLEGLQQRVLHHKLRLIGIIATHGHPDHVGGNWMGMKIPGIGRLASTTSVPVYVHDRDLEVLLSLTHTPREQVRLISEESPLSLGPHTIRVIHTPGHTPGCVCLLVDGRLVTGDTLFVGGCGRTDLPGGDPAALFNSLHQVLGTLPDDVIVCPGHSYGGSSSTLGEERRTNYALRASSRNDWLRTMAADDESY